MTRNALLIAAAFIGTLFTTADADARSLSGRNQTTTRVRAFGTDRFRPITFMKGEIASVILKGDGDTDLDLYVYDEYGTLVAKDDDYTDGCVAMWTPRRTAPFYIVVRNRGRVYNQYVMITN